MLEVPAVADGVLGEIIKHEGDIVKAEEILGRISKGKEKWLRVRQHLRQLNLRLHLH